MGFNQELTRRIKLQMNEIKSTQKNNIFSFKYLKNTLRGVFEKLQCDLFSETVKLELDDLLNLVETL
jgi:hypothetical protein